MLKPIHLKRATELDGTLSGIEIWQGDNHITVSLELHNLHKNSYTWSELKEALDRMAENYLKEVKAALEDRRTL